MQLLLDAHAFLWWVDDAKELSRRARLAIADPGNECLLSLASCWKMAIKKRAVSTGDRNSPGELKSNAVHHAEVAG